MMAKNMRSCLYLVQCSIYRTLKLVNHVQLEKTRKFCRCLLVTAAQQCENVLNAMNGTLKTG